MKENDKPIPTWKHKLHEVIYEADTPAGKFFDIAILVVIIISVALVMMESVSWMLLKYSWEFYVAEWIITGIFTVEYILRLIAINKPKRYIFSFYGIVDLLSTLPSYIGFIFGGANLLFAIRALRLLRVFRILKVTRYIGESRKLISALKNSKAKILVFLFAVLIICVIAGTLMHLVEGSGAGFDNIPLSIYWCIVTLTTVGFGDIAPVTPLGRLIASLIMITGYGIIAVPTGIVSAEFSKAVDKPINNTQACPNCNEGRHLDDAEFCHNCGYKLNV
ncbi:ion transporter [Christiangramia forsetii]|uniref:Voltage-dependent potassium channel n=2 Tax=Christiangramia forsetii TaxID=411153 RepID=A0LZ44_CHRFK|nr:ion transporter [Christiangramia forsetii]GGG37396.1 ion transporter [Christiangramia forsetii]CAL65639.1 voltage-dependent potassium channel [Christiangramia forsetii KT0803]